MEKNTSVETENRGRAVALLPIGIFLVMFIGSGIITRDFYAMPTIVAFLIALAVAFFQNPSLNFNEKIKVCAKGIGDDNVIIMCLIFLAAGGFSGAVTAAGGATSAVYLGLSLIPPKFAVVGVFLIGCFISISMGTSVGTIVALSPIAVGISQATGFSLPLCLGAVVSGAMFGDNLSMISDTTIAAVRTQGCQMSDKFKMNFKIVLPAAIAAAVIFFITTMHGSTQVELGEYNILQVIPYLIVLVGAIIGFNVFVVLIVGTVAAVAAGLVTGTMAWGGIFTAIGSGVTSMYDITVISITVAAIGALVKEYGGIDFILHFIHKNTKSKKGAQIGIAGLVAGVDLATANNTIAIVMTGQIAKEISSEYDIDPRRTASLLDIFASVVQGIIPYGAQLLSAAAAASITAYEIIPFLYYPFFMAVSALVFIFLVPQKDKK
ncbi:MAG: Na+/H+ antiporter NhaC family protein [Candidatus Fimisoma sp.]|nr:Na+/H+ antiporter NhaC family protein [Bacillota bacterium]MDD7284784.1 Na+/H+ antiporter NhaC family protein [Bacillota bacterium]